MKNFRLLIIALFVALSTQIINATNYAAQTFYMIKVYNSKSETSPEKSSDVEGRRTPARPIPCTISENGIEFTTGADDIISYELWDVDGDICLGVYSDDIDAANHIFSTPGEYQLVIEAGDYYYIGYINSL